MRKTLAYAVLVLGLLGVVAANYTENTASGSRVKTAEYIPWPPHAQ